jgi:ABC-type polysaccharide/polyol phosphate export permease
MAWTLSRRLVKRSRATDAEEIYDSAARRPVVDDLREIWRRRRLIRVLVRRDLDLRYRRSVLGLWWTLLNPMLEMLVLSAVFSSIFRFSSKSAPYVVYVLSGIIVANLTRNVILSVGSSLGVNSVFLTRIRLPGEVFALAAVGELLVSFFLSLIPLLAIMLVVGPGLNPTLPLIVVPCLLLALFALGVGLILAPMAARFPDVIVLTSVVLTLVTYLAPVFYPFSIVPERYRLIEQCNPLFYFLRAFRSLLYENSFGPGGDYLAMAGSALVALVLGGAIFSRSRKGLVGALS